MKFIIKKMLCCQLKINSPSPIFSLVLNTGSGVCVERCFASVFMQSPSPRGCSLKTSTEEFSTGRREPTRSLSSQYANSHQPDLARSVRNKKNILQLVSISQPRNLELIKCHGMSEKKKLKPTTCAQSTGHRNVKIGTESH